MRRAKPSDERLRNQPFNDNWQGFRQREPNSRGVTVSRELDDQQRANQIASLLAHWDGTATLEDGLTARDVAGMIEVSKKDVNRALYRFSPPFIATEDAPPLWFIDPDTLHQLPEASDVVATEPGDAAPLLARPPLPTYRDLSLRAWQWDALFAWQDSDYLSGIVEAVTGAGKTRLAIAAILFQLDVGGRVVVVVPSKELMYQWHRELCSWFGDFEIGLLGDGEADSIADCDIVVAIVNSAISSPMDFGEADSVMLVADECHRYGSPQFRRVLDERFDVRLGLSATHERPDGAHEEVLLPYFDGVVYELGYQQAKDEGVIAPVRVAMIGVEISEQERAVFDLCTEELRSARSALVGKHGVPPEPFGEFIAEVNRLTKEGTQREGIAANRYLKYFTERRRILAETPVKRAALGSLLDPVRESDRCLVFSETIDAAENAAEMLRANGITAEALHSELKRDERRAVFEEFRSGELAAICAARVVDEGVDVPDADLAIVLAASQQRRQMVQRMGRVLRSKHDGRHARFAIVFVKDTHEDPASGAHEAFFDQVLDIAEASRTFEASEVSEIREFLKP